MNIPYKFTFTATNDYGILWNPWGTDLSALTSQVNAVLTDAQVATNATRLSLLLPYGPFWLTRLSCQTTSAGDGSVTLGLYDTVASAWTPLYPILATDAAGGGIAEAYDDGGISVPQSATYVPMFKYNGVAGGTVSGVLSMYCPAVVALASGVATNDALLDEAGGNILDESTNPILAG